MNDMIFEIPQETLGYTISWKVERFYDSKIN